MLIAEVFSIKMPYLQGMGASVDAEFPDEVLKDKEVQYSKLSLALNGDKIDFISVIFLQ